MKVYKFNIERLVKIIRFYFAAMLIVLPTIYLQAAGIEAQVFGEVGTGISIHELGGVLIANSGIFRASEIAAWHVAAAACFIILLLTERRPTIARSLVALAIVLVLVGIGVSTGRRKFIVIIALFSCTYAALSMFFLRKSAVVLIGAIIVAAFGYLAGASLFGSDPNDMLLRTPEYDRYVARTGGVFGEVPDRFMELGLAPILWAYEHFGIWGGGLGIATQGVQNFIPDAAHLGAGEGGLGKIMLELGVPGIALIAMLGLALARHIWGILKFISRYSDRATRLACGILAFLIANAASFSVATQAFGDVFILIIFGHCLGFLLALPVLVQGTVLNVNESSEHLRSLVSATGRL